MNGVLNILIALLKNWRKALVKEKMSIVTTDSTSLWEVKMITKFEEDMLGQIITSECVHAEMMAKKSASNLNMKAIFMKAKCNMLII